MHDRQARPIGRRAFLALTLLLALAACGKRGPLRRPEAEGERDGRR